MPPIASIKRISLVSRGVSSNPGTWRLEVRSVTRVDLLAWRARGTAVHLRAAAPPSPGIRGGRADGSAGLVCTATALVRGRTEVVVLEIAKLVSVPPSDAGPGAPRGTGPCAPPPPGA